MSGGEALAVLLLTVVFFACGLAYAALDWNRKDAELAERDDLN